MTATPSLSPRMSGIKPSPASVLRRRARELRAAGRDIIELSSGNLDFPTPDHVIAAAHQAALRGETRYTDVDGTPELKQAVQRRAAARSPPRPWAGRDHDHRLDQALFNALLATLASRRRSDRPRALLGPVSRPVRLAGATPVVVPCAQNNGFKLRAEDLRAAISARTRWVVINNPVNPSGALYSREDLSEIAAVLLQHPDICGAGRRALRAHRVQRRARADACGGIEPRLKPRTLDGQRPRQVLRHDGLADRLCRRPCGADPRDDHDPVADHGRCIVDQPGRRGRRARWRAGCAGRARRDHFTRGAIALPNSSTDAPGYPARRQKARSICWSTAPA